LLSTPSFSLSPRAYQIIADQCLLIMEPLCSLWANTASISLLGRRNAGIAVNAINAQERQHADHLLHLKETGNIDACYAPPKVYAQEDCTALVSPGNTEQMQSILERGLNLTVPTTNYSVTPSPRISPRSPRSPSVSPSVSTQFSTSPLLIPAARPADISPISISPPNSFSPSQALYLNQVRLLLENSPSRDDSSHEHSSSSSQEISSSSL